MNYILLLRSNFFRGTLDFLRVGEIDSTQKVIFIGANNRPIPNLIPKKENLCEELFIGGDSTQPPLSELRQWPYIGIVRALRKIKSEYPSNNFTIVFGKGDYEWTEQHEFYIPENVVKIFANNVSFKSARSFPYPVGRDFRLAKKTYLSADPKIAANYSNVKVTKSISCYANFSTNTHIERHQIEHMCKLNPTIDSEDLGSKYLDYTLSYGDFFNKIVSSKFVICPQGNGIDSFRLWDSLYFGCIPIVTNDDLYKLMPIEMPLIKLSIDEIARVNFHELALQYDYFWEDDFQKDLSVRLSGNTWRKIMFDDSELA